MAEKRLGNFLTVARDRQGIKFNVDTFRMRFDIISLGNLKAWCRFEFPVLISRFEDMTILNIKVHCN